MTLLVSFYMELGSAKADYRVHVRHFLRYASQKKRLQTEKQPGYERDGEVIIEICWSNKFCSRHDQSNY